MFISKRWFEKESSPFSWLNNPYIYPNLLNAKFGWNWHKGYAEEDFEISSIYFCYFVIITPWKRDIPPHSTRMLCSMFGWNWPSDSWDKDFQISSMYFRYFVNISSGKRRGPSFEETFVPFTDGWFVLFGWNWWFLRRKYL